MSSLAKAKFAGNKSICVRCNFSTVIALRTLLTSEDAEKPRSLLPVLQHLEFQTFTRNAYF